MRRLGKERSESSTQHRTMAKPQSHTRGGCGLSLEKFAGAKLSTHNKQQAEEKRQALTAGRINNFRKLKKQLARQSLAAAPSSPSDAQQSAPARCVGSAIRQQPQRHTAVPI